MAGEGEELAGFIDLPPSEEEIRHEERRRFRWYVALAALVALVAGAAIGRFALRPTELASDGPLTPPPEWNAARPAPSEGTPPPSPTPSLLHVYVSGAVESPGVVELPQGSLLRDALEAVGGPTAAADLDAINLAAPLHDNNHVIVPTLPAAEEPPPTRPPAGEDLVNINTATAAELETLPHIGPSTYADLAPLITVGP